MSETIEGRTFVGLTDADSRRVVEDLVLRKCSFIGCAVSVTRDPSLRSTVRRVELVQCEQRGSTIYSAVCDEVVIDGLKSHTLLQCWGAVFRHVTIRGRVGRIMTSPAVFPGTATPRQQQAFDRANAEFYSTVDWALDISNAEFEEGDFRGIPARMIRRDSETQFVVTRERALKADWKEIERASSFWAVWIKLFLQGDESDVVLIAPKRHRNFKKLLAGLQALRAAGVAEAD